MAINRSLLDEVVACTTMEEAETLVERELQAFLTRNPRRLREEARRVVLDSIGYMSGYVSRKEAARILDLFQTRHPYFGSIEEWPTTPEQCIAMGKMLGERIKRGDGSVQ